VRFDLNPYALQVLSIFGPAAMFFLLLVGAGSGQNTTLISLDQAIDLALAHSHSLKATRTLILQNQAQEITANLRPNPTLGADSQFVPFFSPQDFSGTNLNETQQFDIGIGYLFERGHKRQRRLQAARDQTAVTRAQVTDAERTLAFNVGQQFVSVFLAESTLQFALQDLQASSRRSTSARRNSRRATSGKAITSKSSCSFCSFRPTRLRPALPKSGHWLACVSSWATTRSRPILT
jgi:outer membrane protein TolC